MEEAEKEKSNSAKEVDNETFLTGEQKFVINVHNVICDVLISEIARRSVVYKNVLKDFQLFFDFQITIVEFNECVERLMVIYKSDIDVKYFKDEITQFICYVQEEKVNNPVEQYKFIIGGLQSTFPNVETILIIFLTIPISKLVVNVLFRL